MLATLINGDTSIGYGYDSGSVRTTKTVNGVKYTYVLKLCEKQGDSPMEQYMPIVWVVFAIFMLLYEFLLNVNYLEL